MAPLRIQIDAWRGLPHSYALTAQYAALELLKRPGTELTWNEAPIIERWKRPSPIADQTNPHAIFAEADEQALRRIPAPSASSPPDVIIRSAYPLDFRGSPCRKVLVWGTTEQGIALPGSYLGGASLGDACAASPSIHTITPSRWSRDGFLRSGVPADRVHVVPLGVPLEECTAPMPEQRAAARAAFNLPLDSPILLNIGAMTTNKGISHLYQAIAAISAKHKNLVLVLKGLDSLYDSRHVLWPQGVGVPEPVFLAVMPHVRYIGDEFTAAQMRQLYWAADAYVCPYRAEGFNMPALEAVARGLTVIATKGGPTDDFLDSRVAIRVNSTIRRLPDIGGMALVPDERALAAAISRVITDRTLREQSRTHGPAWVAERFTWVHTVDRVLDLIHAMNS